MPLRTLLAAAAQHLPMPVRLTLSRVGHGETTVQQSPARWRARARARLVRDDPSRTSVKGAMLARSVQGIDSHAEVRAAVSRVLAAAEIDHVVIPIDAGEPQMAIDSADLPRLYRALTGLAHPDTWRVTSETPLRTRTRQLPRARWFFRASTQAITVARVYCGVDGREINSTSLAYVRIEIWDTLEGGEERLDGEEHEPGTRVGRTPPTTVPYLRQEDWDALAHGSATAPAFVLNHLMTTLEPIDVVYTWVDGDDPEWIRRKAAAPVQTGTPVNRTADAVSRFASRDELRFSLRSLELFAPWVRHIYVVTDGQRPEWLVDSHPRLTVVDHTEIFSDPTVLPVFNSHAIESQLHHIEGLSDRYLYLNDDVFLGRTVPKERFFASNGISNFFLSTATLDVGPRSARDLPVLSAAKRTVDLVAEHWGVSITNKFKHTPHTQSRAVLEEMEGRFPELFAAVASSRIRHPDDFSIASALQHYYAYLTGRAVPSGIRYAYIDIAADDAELRLLRLLRDRDREVFCLNDTFADEEQHRRAERLGVWFLNSYFPVPSSFERADT